MTEPLTVWPVWEPVPGKAWRLLVLETEGFLRAKPTAAEPAGYPRRFDTPEQAIAWAEKHGLVVSWCGLNRRRRSRG